MTREGLSRELLQLVSASTVSGFQSLAGKFLIAVLPGVGVVPCEARHIVVRNVIHRCRSLESDYPHASCWLRPFSVIMDPTRQPKPVAVSSMLRVQYPVQEHLFLPARAV